MRCKVLNALTVVALLVYSTGCTDDPVIPEPEPAPRGPFHVGRYSGEYRHSNSVNHQGNYYFGDTTFQAILHVREGAAEVDPRQRLASFDSLPYSHQIWVGEQLMVWNEADQWYYSENGRMSFFGPREDSVSIYRHVIGTNHQNTYWFKGVRQQ